MSEALQAAAPCRIAVIGGGASGTLLAIHLVRTASAPTEIELIEKDPVHGLGVAYRTREPLHVLNVPACRMSALPGDPDHFLRWLRRRPDLAGEDVRPSTFVPRMVYGAYLQDLFAQTCEESGPHLRLTRRQAEALDLSAMEDGWQVTLTSGEALSSDRVVLALGNFPPRQPRLEDGSALPAAFAVPDPWSPAALEGLDPSAPTLLLGTGLTMVDVALSLHARGHTGPLYALSRRGLLPQSHLPETPCWPPFLEVDELPRTAAGLLRRVRGEVQKAQAEEQDWRSVVDAFRPLTQAAWQGLPVPEQRRFLRHLQPYWDTHRHRLAPPVAERVHALIASGQLQVMAGRVRSSEVVGDRLRLHLRPRHAEGEVMLDVARVINCTGPCSQLRHAPSPLIQGLLDAGHAATDPLGLGFGVRDSGQLLSPQGEALPGVYALGSLTKGHFWETIAIPELSVQTERMAGELLRETEG